MRLRAKPARETEVKLLQLSFLVRKILFVFSGPSAQHYKNVTLNSLTFLYLLWQHRLPTKSNKHENSTFIQPTWLNHISALRNCGNTNVRGGRNGLGRGKIIRPILIGEIRQ